MKSGGAAAAAPGAAPKCPCLCGCRSLDDAVFSVRQSRDQRAASGSAPIHFVEHHELAFCGQRARGKFPLQNFPTRQPRRPARLSPFCSKTCRVFWTRSRRVRRIINARRVDEQHRPQRQQFHRLFHRIGVVPATGENRNLLARQRIEQRRFATLRRPKKAMCRRRLLGGGHGCPLRAGSAPTICLRRFSEPANRFGAD